MIKDPHDPRDFRLYVSIDKDGSVIATHAFEATLENPGDQFIEVTDLGLADYGQVKIAPALVSQRLAAKDAFVTAQLQLAEARGAAATATMNIITAIATALTAPVVINEVPKVP